MLPCPLSTQECRAGCARTDHRFGSNAAHDDKDSGKACSDGARE